MEITEIFWRKNKK